MTEETRVYVDLLASLDKRERLETQALRERREHLVHREAVVSREKEEKASSVSNQLLHLSTTAAFC